MMRYSGLYLVEQQPRWVTTNGSHRAHGVGAVPSSTLRLSPSSWSRRGAELDVKVITELMGSASAMEKEALGIELGTAPLAELADAASGRYVEYVRVRDGKDRREKGDKPGNLPRPPGYFCAWSSARC